MNANIKWETPPSIVNGPVSIYPQIFATLAQRPGEWARIRDFKNPASATSAAQYVRDHHAGREYEVVSRGKHIYARFIGKAGKRNGRDA